MPKFKVEKPSMIEADRNNLRNQIGGEGETITCPNCGTVWTIGYDGPGGGSTILATKHVYAPKYVYSYNLCNIIVNMCNCGVPLHIDVLHEDMGTWEVIDAEHDLDWAVIDND